MIRHVSTEDISAYLDSELGYAEVGPFEAHCASCADCSWRLTSMRRVVNGLGSFHRAEPPAALRHQIRREVQTAPPGGLAHQIKWALESLRILLFPIRPTLRASAALGLAAVAGLFAVSHGVGDGFLRNDEPQPRRAIEIVETHMGEPLGLSPQTTSEVAGRKFIWTDAGWVQRGLEGETPETRLDSHSPQGKALLTRYSDLQFLLEDGSSVVLRYNLETVEIRSIPPVTRILGSRPQTGRGHVRAVSA
jgi:hypothetical protein